MSGWKVNNKMTGVKVAWFEDERNAEDWVGERSKPEYFQIVAEEDAPAVEQQDDSEFDRERAEQDRARIAAGEAQPMAAQGVEAWGVYDGEVLFAAFSDRDNAEASLMGGATIRRGRFVLTPDCLCSEHRAGDVDSCPACYKQPAEDAVTVDGVLEALKQLDGSERASVKLLTGFSDETLTELGGFKDDAPEDTASPRFAAGDILTRRDGKFPTSLERSVLGVFEGLGVYSIVDRNLETGSHERRELPIASIDYFYDKAGEIPKPAPAKSDLETVIREATFEWESGTDRRGMSRTEYIAAAVRAHYEGTGK